MCDVVFPKTSETLPAWLSRNWIPCHSIEWTPRCLIQLITVALRESTSHIHQNLYSPHLNDTHLDNVNWMLNFVERGVYVFSRYWLCWVVRRCSRRQQLHRNIRDSLAQSENHVDAYINGPWQCRSQRTVIDVPPAHRTICHPCCDGSSIICNWSCRR